MSAPSSTQGLVASDSLPPLCPWWCDLSPDEHPWGDVGEVLRRHSHNVGDWVKVVATEHRDDLMNLTGWVIATRHEVEAEWVSAPDARQLAADLLAAAAWVEANQAAKRVTRS